MKKSILNGAQILVNCLTEQGVNHIFGYPGASILSVYGALDGSPVRHTMTADEQGACFAAEGYARASGKAGVVLATSGPGATNLVTGIADAYMDSVPLVAITGNVPLDKLGHDSFQEVDIFDMTMPVTKYSIIVKDVKDLAPSIRKAFKVATSGRKGPVLVDIPSNVFDDVTEYEKEIPTADAPVLPDEDELNKIAEIINRSERPVIYVGGGVKASGASEILKEFALKICAQVAVSYMGVGCYDPDDASYLGVMSNVNPTPLHALRECDLFITLGARFNSRYNAFGILKRRKIPVVQIDIDKAEIDKNVLTTASVTADINETLKALLPLVKDNFNEDWAFRDFDKNELSNRGTECIKCLSDILGPDVIVTTDVGLHQEWTAHIYRFTSPSSFLTSGGLGAMGFGLGAAIGAHFATDKKCLCVTGDGSFNMNMNELPIALKNRIPLVVAVMNNNSLGMIRKLQAERAGRRVASSALYLATDYVQLANAMGVRAVRIDETDDVKTKLTEALNGPLPLLIDFRIGINEGL